MTFYIKKWVQPYLLIERLKEYYDVIDLTFNGATKLTYKAQMLEAVEKGAIGLYMKNVNKFYVLSPKSEVDLVGLVKEKLELVDDDIISESDIEATLSLVDLGKSEASFIVV